MKHFILSVDEINKLQMENEAYKQSEQEASEIIAELQHTLDCKNGTIETLKAKNIELKERNEKIIVGYIKLSERYKQTLQEIKTIAGKLMSDNLCNNCDGIGLDANCQDTGCPYYQMDNILQKITKAEEE